MAQIMSEEKISGEQLSAFIQAVEQLQACRAESERWNQVVLDQEKKVMELQFERKRADEALMKARRAVLALAEQCDVKHVWLD